VFNVSRSLRAHLIICSVLVAGAIGCTARLYDGPQRDAAEISTITLVRAHPNMVFRAVRIDSQSVNTTQYGFTSDFEILPGTHTLSFTVKVDADAYCDAREHLCPASVVEGFCSGSFETRPGEKYAVQMADSRGELRAFVRPARTLDNLAVGSSDALSHLQCNQAQTYQSLENSNSEQF